MSRTVFINDHLEGVYESVRAARRQAELELEVSRLRETIVDLIEAGGSALHATFEAGGEPKWRVPEERERMIALSDKLREAFKKVSGWDA